MSSVSRYAFANARLRTRLAVLPRDSFLDQLAKAGSVSESMGMLRSTLLADLVPIWEQTGDLKRIELELERRDINFLVRMQGLLPGPAGHMLKILNTRFEIRELKNILRLWFDRTVRGSDVSDQTPYLVRIRIGHDMRVDDIIASKDLQTIARLLEGSPWAGIVLDHANAVTGDGNLFFLENALDRYWFAQLESASRGCPPSDYTIAKKYVSLDADRYNTALLLEFLHEDRSLDEVVKLLVGTGKKDAGPVLAAAWKQKDMKQLFAALPAAKYVANDSTDNENPGDILGVHEYAESIMDKAADRLVRTTLGSYPFTIGIVMAYFSRASLVRRRIIAVLNARQYNMDADVIRQSLEVS